MPGPLPSTGLTITNPLVLYRALLATKRIDPDPAQHRLAIHLQKLYERLKDYEPVVQYGHRLNQVSKALGSTPGQGVGQDVGAQQPGRGGVFASLFGQRKERESLALTKVLTSQEAAMKLDSPRGLMLHGEVGTGKSMLIDLFADCLPNRKKKRWHFTTFMLETFSKLEYLRRSRQTIIPASLGREEDYSLLWLARDMIATSPILFLDEFQLPDRAATKIITNLFTSFFQLGGVLICTSNRMPEELAKAAGMEFTPPPSRLDSLNWRFGIGGSRAKSKSDSLFSGAGDFALFLEVLKARCEVWEMESGKDYRRRESEAESEAMKLEQATDEATVEGFEGLEAMSPGNVGLGYEQSLHQTQEQEKNTNPGFPKNYFVKPAEFGEEQERARWLQSYETALARSLGHESAASHSTSSWNSSSMRVYGRDVAVPRQNNGVTQWTFLELCCTNLGPADYISLASTFHTLILTDVPVLTLLAKNEARRFITLLDALYEARCKLIITADAGPDDLFFPETNQPIDSSANPGAKERQTIEQDAVYAETFAEAYQDATAPFRPNISMYDPSSSHSEPNTTHSRFAGFFSDDQLEDQPPNTPHRPGITGIDQASLDERDMRTAQGGPDFSRAGIFTGEDEKFAYKRARSRLWEMCGARWWNRAEDGWWKPVDRAVRRWEGPVAGEEDAVTSTTHGLNGIKVALNASDEGFLGSREVDEKSDEVMFRHGASPFRRSEEPPPVIEDHHVWGVAKWGRRAGAWGKGVEGLGERGMDQGREKEKGGRREGAGGGGDGDGHHAGEKGRRGSKS